MALKLYLAHGVERERLVMAEEKSSTNASGYGKSSASSGAPGYKFPEALLRTPCCLIALSGLDVRNNAVHRLVWEELAGEQTEIYPVQTLSSEPHLSYGWLQLQQCECETEKGNIILSNAHQSAVHVCDVRVQYIYIIYVYMRSILL